MEKNSRPLLAITMGDPAGIGPEIAAQALASEEVRAMCRPLLVGDAGCMREAVALYGLQAQVHPVRRVQDAVFAPGTLEVYDLENVDLSHFKRGEVSAQGGNAAFEAVKIAIQLAMKGEVAGTVTGPINKEALLLAGHHYAGHTEIYADLTGTRDYSMLLAEGKLRVIHVSTHVSLREACDRVKKDRVLKVIRLAGAACRSLGIQNPRIAVAGLNPHAGENGLFGQEEIQEIIPAIETAVSEGWSVSGPWPPDSIFSKAAGGMFDIVVAMYHDQGHIPLKVIGFSLDPVTGRFRAVNGVNMTIGLPIIRTSVDHGTAFDIAGQGIATAESLVTAIEYAVRLAENSGGAIPRKTHP